SSSSSSLSFSSSPASTGGLFLSPPVTPVSSSKSQPNRNDIFSEDWTSPSPTATTGRAAKERLKGLGLPGQYEQGFDVWDSEARKRRSGAWTWNSRTTSRSST